MKEKTMKKNFPVLGLVLYLLLLAGMVVSLVYDPAIFGEGSVFNRPVSENGVVQMLYEKIPAVIRCVRILAVSVTLHLILRALAHISFSKNKRSVTLVKLMTSFLKWVIIIVAALLMLKSFGVDTAAIVAGAGIMTLAVSLGAQSLVADIIAGLFIVLEGEYQVGDIVVIDDWRGTVSEIGIRTTKIVDAGGNVKIVNNSEIKTIVNQTQALSVAKTTMSIEYGESIPRVELVLRDHLDAIRAAIPEIIEGPFYKGVNALSASSVDLLFVAKCKEEDLYTVQRAMNRELKLLFDEYGIGIPFPQITVSRLEAKATVLTPEGARAADAFAEEQAALSKHIEEEKE